MGGFDAVFFPPFRWVSEIELPFFLPPPSQRAVKEKKRKKRKKRHKQKRNFLLFLSSMAVLVRVLGTEEKEPNYEVKMEVNSLSPDNG